MGIIDEILEVYTAAILETEKEKTFDYWVQLLFVTCTNMY